VLVFGSLWGWNGVGIGVGVSGGIVASGDIVALRYIWSR